MTMKRQRTAYSYVRFSTSEQIKGDSQRRQTQATAAYCARNNLVLDPTLTLTDLGVSAFKGKNATTGSLAAFLEAIKSGRVKSGSVLIVESLDRLTRQSLRKARDLFEGILDSGVNIITLAPEREYSAAMLDDLFGVIEPLLYLSRANEESQRKSERLGAAWQAKRARLSDEKLTAKCPAWLRLNDNRTDFIPIPQSVKTVRRIVRLCIDGEGTIAITKRLNGEGIKPIGRAKCWHRSYVIKILKNRSMLGEYQPHTGHNSTDRKPTGDVIPNYYPSIITDAEFYQAQAALLARRGKRGPKGKGIANLFTGLVFDGRDGSTMTLVSKGGKKSGKPKLVSSAAQRGERGSRYLGFDYEAFEGSVLRWLKELRPEDIDPQTSKQKDTADELESVKGRLADVADKIKKIAERIKRGNDTDTMLDILADLEQERTELRARQELLQADYHAVGKQTVDNVLWLSQKMQDAKGKDLETLRTKIKAVIARLITKMTVVVTVDGYWRGAAVTMELANGITRKIECGYRRGNDAIWYKPIGEAKPKAKRRKKTA
jgi:DNA invertase Pin-like site-specific DNA recombinase